MRLFTPPRRLAGLVCALSLAIAAALPLRVAAAQTSAPEPAFRDDRSSPEAVLESLYDAIGRREYLRAWSYFRDEPGRPDFETFAKGYETTRSVRLKLGPATGDGAAGSIFYSVPAVVEATTDAGTAVYTGCYALRKVQPAVQIVPPFQPLGIVEGRLKRSDRSFEAAEGLCPADGLR